MTDVFQTKCTYPFLPIFSVYLLPGSSTGDETQDFAHANAPPLGCRP